MTEHKKSLSDLSIDQSWTLFLDRDGVINEKIDNNYVCNWKQFQFRDGALEMIKVLSSLIGITVIVTNQRCIGRGLITENDLSGIHDKMKLEVGKSGGKIDSIYHCPHIIEDNCNCRKPQTGLALQAKADFPQINFQKSLLIGDSISDMEFAKRLNMTTVLITNQFPVTNNNLIDYHFSDLHILTRNIT